MLCFLGIQARATHIVGGEITYAYAGNNRYSIKLKLYVDCYNGSSAAIAQDEYAIITVYEGDSGKRLDNLCLNIKRNAPVRVSKTNYNCIAIAPNACVDAYEYAGSLVLPPRSGGYYLSFQRCCRNNTILNLINPGGTGDNIWTHISDTAGIGYNSSPEFRNLPPNFLCTNAPLEFDHSATDADGDSLVYEFFHPFLAATSMNPRPTCTETVEPPFGLVTFAGGYGMNNPIPSLPAISLNRNSGLLKLTPVLQGQFVIGICVKEFRSGKLIGFTLRDYQFNVQNCVFTTTSAFASPSVNCNREVFFTNNSSNADRYHWDFGDSSSTSDTADTKDGYYRYKKPGTYVVRLIASKGNCVDSIKKTVTVSDRIHFKLPPDTLLCAGFSMQLKPDTFYRSAAYLWNTGSSDSSIHISGSGQYWLNIKLGNCNTSDTVQILQDNLHVQILKDSLRCDPEKGLNAILKLSSGHGTALWLARPEHLVKKGSSDTMLHISKPGMYLVSGLNKNNCPYTDSVRMDGPDLSYLFRLPNVFTPNSDGINDVFPEQLPPYHFSLQVFNRWGIEVFKGENTAWPAGDFPDGTYYYFIEMQACDAFRNCYGAVKIIR